LVQEGHISLGVEVFGLMPIDKLTVVQRHSAKDLLGVAFAAGRDTGLAMPTRPRLMQRGTLPEGRFVLVND
jgi:hypothetical protein